ncbi:MAG: TetR family transcriptional regulator C-terminal domain-containing protein [Rhodospirillales bacterium]
MAPTSLAERPRNRAASKALRRQQLIDSTIDSIAKRGFADTTLADVAAGAGLSRGIVNFHFESKDQLLVATLQYLADEYRDNWQSALARAGDGAIQRLLALVTADFEARVCNRKKIAVWYAFWGEAKSRPTYLKLCAARDAEYEAVMRSVCGALIAEAPGPALDLRRVVSGIGALTDGLWLDVLLEPKAVDRASALATTLLFLSGLFPAHLAADGSIKKA